MSLSTVDSLRFTTQQVAIYAGFIVLISGLVGNTLNIVIFTSLKTFRQTSCAFYLTAASIVDIVQLLSTVLSRILISGYQIDPSQNSLLFCKLRAYVLNTCTLIWITCLCFATIDQFASLTLRWHHLSHIHVARRLMTVTIVLWGLIGIPVALFNNIYTSPNNNQPTCTITNPTFAIYYSQFVFPVLRGFLPILIRVTFGLLSFIRVRDLVSRQVPVVRSERDKQLTAMVLVEVLVDVLLTLPYVIYYVYSRNTTFVDPESIARDQLIYIVTLILFYSSGAASFYIYCCSSLRFRRQFIHVLINIHLKCCQQRADRLHNNRVDPQSTREQGALAVVENIELGAA